MNLQYKKNIERSACLGFVVVAGKPAASGVKYPDQRVAATADEEYLIRFLDGREQRVLVGKEQERIRCSFRPMAKQSRALFLASCRRAGEVYAEL